MKRTLLLVVLVPVLAGCREPGPPAPAAPPGEPLALEAGVTRTDLRFGCADAECAGWLFAPAGAERAPAVVMAHGCAGTRDVALP